MSKKFGVCRVPVAPLRADASDKAEIVSQLLFGESLIVIEQQESWWLVESTYDQYQGFIDFRHLSLVAEKEAAAYLKTDFLAPLHYNNVLLAADGSRYHLSPGSNLPLLRGNVCQLGEQQFKLNFEAHEPAKSNFEKDILPTAKFFQNTSYLWGGRHCFGMDCSGFVQIVFKMLNIPLMRDASQQALQGEMVAFLAESKAGDLAFFDNAEGRITHVGIMLNNHEIIHSSAKVRIDPIDDQGIYNQELGKYSHKLRIIKRMV